VIAKFLLKTKTKTKIANATKIIAHVSLHDDHVAEPAPDGV